MRRLALVLVIVLLGCSEEPELAPLPSTTTPASATTEAVVTTTHDATTTSEPTTTTTLPPLERLAYQDSRSR